MVICAIPGCFVSRTPKYEGQSLFKIPQRKNAFYSEWRKKLVDVLSIYREMNATFKKEVLDCKRELFICENHFNEEDMILTPENKKTLCDMALPTRNLPKKSFSLGKKERKPPIIRNVDVNVVCDTQVGSTNKNYNSLEELYDDLNTSKWIQDKWIFGYSVNAGLEERCLRIYSYNDPLDLVPHIEIFLDGNFQTTVFVFGWMLPKSHPLFKTVVQELPIEDFLKKLTNLKLCPGITNHESVKSISHIVPICIDYKNNPSVPFLAKTFYRSVNCLVLCDDGNICKKCEGLKPGLCGTMVKS